MGTLSSRRASGRSVEGRGLEGGGDVDRPIVLGQSAQEYFRELVASGLAHRRLRIHEGTEFYVVNLLASKMTAEALFAARPDGTLDAEPLALLLKRALESQREERRRALKRLGDTSL